MAIPPFNGGPNLPPPPGGSTDYNRLMIDGLQRRISMLENRLARLENVVRITDRDVEIQSDGELRISALQKVEVEAGGGISLDGGDLRIVGAVLNVSSAMTVFTGIVQCDTLLASTVSGSTYTPGAGNLW